MGRLRIQILLEYNIWSTRYNIQKKLIVIVIHQLNGC